jgi:hypothetical protein
MGDTSPSRAPVDWKRSRADDVRAPDAIEPITAFRVWRADLYLRLHSLNDQTLWQPGEWTTARCPWSDHAAPHEGCTCGLYAAMDIGLALVLAAGVLTTTSPGDSMPTTAIVGRVQLAGKLIEHARGYRAERARIVEILPIEGRGRLTESLASRFAVPVGWEIPTSSLEPIMRRRRRGRRFVNRHSPATVGPVKVGRVPVRR